MNRNAWFFAALCSVITMPVPVALAHFPTGVVLPEFGRIPEPPDQKLQPKPLEPGYAKMFAGFRVAEIHFSIQAAIKKDWFDDVVDATLALAQVEVATEMPAVGLLKLEQPRPGLVTWVIPNTGGWENYTFCNYDDFEALKIPHDGSDVPTYNWKYIKTRSGAFEWSITRRGSFEGSSYLTERVWYFVIHKDDLAAAVAKKACRPKAPNGD